MLVTPANLEACREVPGSAPAVFPQSNLTLHPASKTNQSQHVPKHRSCTKQIPWSRTLKHSSASEAIPFLLQVPDERGDAVLLCALRARGALPEKERLHRSSGSLPVCVQLARCFHQAGVGKEAVTEHLCSSCRAWQAEQILPFLTKCIGARWNCSAQSSA